MTVVIRILVVEDDNATLKQWNMAIDILNVDIAAQNIHFDLKTAVSAADARALMSDSDFDIAVVDINLKNPGNNAGNKDGNIVLQEVLDSELAAVAVFSGEPTGSASPPSWAKNITIFPKGNKGMSAVLEWLLLQVPMIRQIKLANKKIKKEMVQLFTRSIWPRWNQWVATINPAKPEFIADALTRHLTAHMYGTFLEKSDQKVHPEEWYFIPPIRDGLRTGDLIRDSKGDVEIVITPRCDLAVADKTETVMLAKCYDVSAEWVARCNKITTASENLSNENDVSKHDPLRNKLFEAKEGLRRYTQHGGGKASIHFLPSMQLSDGTKAGPFMVQFDNIRSIAKSEAAEIDSITSKRMASLTSEFLPSLVERLGGYFSRIGTPDYSHHS